MTATTKIPLIGLSRDELQELLVAHEFQKFRTKQVWSWIYAHGAREFSQMSSISKDQQKRMDSLFSIARPQVPKDLTSFDGTRKWLVEFPDGNKVETVFIPEEDRGALCVSSQVGCTLSCSFCHTGTMPLVRNLSAADIVNQILVARDGLGEWDKPRAGEGAPKHNANRDPRVKEPSAREAAAHVSDHLSPNGGTKILTNIVMMGMGEPLYNYENVAKALNIIMDGEGVAISKRRITLSTSGVVPMIEKCGAELGVNLAISLHAVRDDLRDVLVPLNKKYPIKELLEACRRYPAANNARRITFEYVMLKDVNDSDADARELCRLLKGIHAKVNLIPWNPWPGAPYETSSRNRQHAFAKIVNDAGYSSPIRATRGQDIFAACGQLKSDSERKKGQKVWLGNE